MVVGRRSVRAPAVGVRWRRPRRARSPRRHGWAGRAPVEEASTIRLASASTPVSSVVGSDRAVAITDRPSPVPRSTAARSNSVRRSYSSKPSSTILRPTPRTIGSVSLKATGVSIPPIRAGIGASGSSPCRDRADRGRHLESSTLIAQRHAARRGVRRTRRSRRLEPLLPGRSILLPADRFFYYGYLPPARPLYETGS